jgi:hypothetical protein
MYGLLILLALIGRDTLWVRYSVRALAVLAVLANFIGVADMTRLGAFCFFCLFDDSDVTIPVMGGLSFSELHCFSQSY